MSSPRKARLEAAIVDAIEHPKKRNSLTRCMKRGRDSRSERLATLHGGAAFRQEVKAIKTRCIEQLPELQSRFIAAAEARGCQVYLAADGAEVAEICLRIAQERAFTQVSKSKSLTTEEIELNDDLQAAGLTVIETDLGELIIQLVGDKPFHLVFPSVHKMRDEVAEIFSKETGKPVPPDVDAIMKVVREYLRPIFLNTDIGMTGANIGIAETGGIVIETNEGNGRLVSSIGKCHICVMGMEKIVDTLDDAMMMVLAHPVSASGQLPTTYVTWMGGRSPLGVDGVERESHIIILDNGRSRMREDPAMQEALRCIRCGACMNICPTYGVVGGHVFGHIYPGPIGIPWTSEVHGLETAGDFAELCISCGLCKEICPAEIDMPLMIAEVKQRDAEEHGYPATNRMLMAAESMAKLGCTTAPLANWSLRQPWMREIMDRFLGIDKRRSFPAFDGQTLNRRFRKRARKLRGAAPNAGSARKVVFFADLFVQYNRGDLGMRAIEALEAAGCEVVLPKLQGCGYPYIGYGNLNAARDAALYNLARIAPYVEQGYAVVTPEPTAAYCLKIAWPKLLPYHPHAKQVAEASHEIFEYLLAQGFEGGANALGKRYGFHCSCHQRPLGAGAGVQAWLKARGAQVEFLESGTCCGMAGTFGMKAGALGYDLANAVGEPLFELFKGSGVEAVVTESSVCAIHLRDGTGLPVLHPLELL
ncbi:MAG: 4Fe-4S dicluster domain-containing protein [Candidatus Hydrogenedens sp.]|nr:4Fe-4S dicluster domain-containing protein [Candidatus Hydrogenedens sp.]